MMFFDEFVFENIKYGLFGVSEFEIIDVVKKVYVYCFIFEEFEEGYDICIGEYGGWFLGG